MIEKFMTYFVEGIQGSGKSTLVKLLSEKCPDHRVLEEGDYSPVELAWCAYIDRDQYIDIMDHFSALKPEIEAKTHFEDDHAVVCYTKIRTDDRSFYQAMEKYEIYNNRVSFERFKLGRCTFDHGVCSFSKYRGGHDTVP